MEEFSPMRLSYLREFVSLTDYTKLTSAAHGLHLSPSTLSQHISVLEKELGCELFSREGGFTLTPAGEVALKHARNIIDEYDALLADCMTYDKNTVFFRFPVHDLLQPPLAAAEALFLERHPDLKVVFSANESDLEDPFETLSNGSNDVSHFYYLRGRDDIENVIPEDIVRIPIGAYRIVFVCDSRHPNACKHPLTRNELDGAIVASNLDPVSYVFTEQVVEELKTRNISIHIQYRRLIRSTDALYDNMGDKYFLWFEPLENAPGNFDVPGYTAIPFEHDMVCDAYLLYRPASLTPLQREYLDIVKALKFS